MKSGFFDSNIMGYDLEGMPIFDNAVDSAFFAKYFASFLSNGVFMNTPDALQVITSSGMDIIIRPGRCLINGYFGWQEDDMRITIEKEIGASRIDLVVARLDLMDLNVNLHVVKGLPSPNPISPTLTRPTQGEGGDIYEICLAQIRVNSNASQITQANITDTRLNKSLCGIVTGVITQVDTTTLYNQIQGDFNDFRNNTQSDYNSWTTEKKAAFEAYMALRISQMEQFDESFKNSYIGDFEKWYKPFKQNTETDVRVWFANLKNTLDDNQAANLYNKIDSHENNTLTSSGGVHGLRISNGRLQGQMGAGWATLLKIPTGMTAAYFNNMGLSVTQFNNLGWTVEDFNNQIMIESE